jgi:hypothetical protein
LTGDDPGLVDELLAPNYVNRKLGAGIDGFK